METKSQLTELPSGLRIATCEMPHAETAAMGIWASVGGRHEPAPLSGISHFIEHMLFKGTARRSAARIMQEIEGVGGDMNAFTAEERTCYYATAAAEYFPRVCDVLCDLYVNPRFAKRDIDRERGVNVAEQLDNMLPVGFLCRSPRLGYVEDGHRLLVGGEALQQLAAVARARSRSSVKLIGHLDRD